MSALGVASNRGERRVSVVTPESPAPQSDMIDLAPPSPWEGGGRVQSNAPVTGEIGVRQGLNAAVPPVRQIGRPGVYELVREQRQFTVEMFSV